MTEKPSTPESIIEHQSKYQNYAWRQYTVAELGQWVHLLVKRAGHRTDLAKKNKDLVEAQNYLDMMQAHILAGMSELDVEPNELPVVETTDPPLTAEKLNSAMRRRRIAAAWENDGKEVHEPNELPAVERTELDVILAEANRTKDDRDVIAEPMGQPRDAQGNVTRISTQPGDPGYDPEVHENLALQIFCDGQHIPTAHTADTTVGTVWFYEKNAQGRIKTLTAHGKVEIRGL